MDPLIISNADIRWLTLVIDAKCFVLLIKFRGLYYGLVASDGKIRRFWREV